jgi:hypothetical protein
VKNVIQTMKGSMAAADFVAVHVQEAFQQRIAEPRSMLKLAPQIRHVELPSQNAVEDGLIQKYRGMLERYKMKSFYLPLKPDHSRLLARSIDICTSIRSKVGYVLFVV